MAPEVHRIAEQGFGEGTNVLYDAYKPTYPAEQLDFIQSHLNNPQGPLNVLELGAGTGIFTRCLLAHKTFGQTVGQLHAVEPSAGTREQFSRTVVDERVSCREGVFERTGEDDGWADLVVVAQVHLWFRAWEPFGRLIDRLGRRGIGARTDRAWVLKPGGVVALIWNLEDMEVVAWVASNRKAYEAYEQGTPQFRLGLWRKMCDTRAIRFFSRQEEREVTWTCPLRSTGLWDDFLPEVMWLFWTKTKRTSYERQSKLTRRRARAEHRSTRSKGSLNILIRT